jgi:hypothetical protein
MQKIDASNILFTLASDLVNHTAKNIFLTGKAGTGKTTFLKYIRENCPKQMVVVAPTGVAAINAGGVTIHSFFQLPFSPFIPETKGFHPVEEVTNKHSLLSRLRLNSERRKIITELELLIIDEVSMVRCDVLDAIDLILRHVRHRHAERFGGVQVLFIGDMFQLPPVVKEQEWNLLRDYYRSPYFFDSYVMKEDPPLYIELAKIYRQTEENFIHLLNKIRNNEMDEEDLNALHQRFKPDFFSVSSDGYILLTTHNDKAREINTQELEKLPEKLFTYKAEVENEFPSTSFPAEEILQLKVGAQVMFIKNDTDKTKKYYNGKIGVISELEKDKIFVQCKDESEPIEVAKEKWENIRYAFDKSTRQVNEDVLGSFNQYPLRLAWAITIHKSQGLTFDKAVIDAGKAFAPGQVYVALSRCTNLEGMILHSRIRPHALCADDCIVQFTKNILPLEELQQELMAAKKAYQEKVFSSLFDFRKTLYEMKELNGYLLQYRSSFNEEVYPWSEGLLSKLEILQTTGEKFHVQLRKLFGLTEKTADNIELHERLKRASNWFSCEIKSLIENILQSPAVTDSTIHAKQYNGSLKEIYVQLAQLNFLLEGFSGRFNTESFHRRKNSFSAPSFSMNAYTSANEKKTGLVHPSLFYKLKKLRDDICAKKSLPIYLVASSKTLEEMTTYLPQNLEELEQIKGFGKAKIDAYGDGFLSIIKEYALENNLSSNISKLTPKHKRKESKQTKADTRAESFRLYEEGKTINEISQDRALTTQTIEGHLAHYVQNGFIEIEKLVSHEKVELICTAAKGLQSDSVAPIKEKLGAGVTWGEIRMVMAWLEYQKLSSHVNH